MGGSTAKEAGLDLSYGVYPACAGIDHKLYKRFCRFSRLPRMRGDRPLLFVFFCGKSLPRMRGDRPVW